MSEPEKDSDVGLSPPEGEARMRAGETGRPAPRRGPKAAAMRRDEQEALRRHLAALSRAQAEVLKLRYCEGLSRKEIAELFETSESVVKSRLHEALRCLDRLVKGDRR